MFKEATIYNFVSALELKGDKGTELEKLCAALAQVEYKGVPESHLKSSGFTSPLPEHVEDRQIAYKVMGRIIMKHVVGEKKIDAEEVNAQVDERVELLEKDGLRKVGRKERDQIKDEIMLDMLPGAFVHERSTYLYIYPGKGLLVVGAKSDKKVEDICSQLRGAFGSLGIALPPFEKSPRHVMTSWLENVESLPEELALESGAVLETDEKAKVTIKGDDPNGDVAKIALEAGYKCVQLDMMYDDRTRFTINDDFRLSRIKETDTFKEQIDEKRMDQEGSDGMDGAMLALNSDFPLIADSIESIWAVLVGAVGLEQPPTMW